MTLRIKAWGTYPPPSPLRGSVWRCGGGLRPVADSAERSASRACACGRNLGGAGESFPRSFVLERSILNATSCESVFMPCGDAGAMRNCVHYVGVDTTGAFLLILAGSGPGDAAGASRPDGRRDGTFIPARWNAFPLGVENGEEEGVQCLRDVQCPLSH